MKLGTLKRGGRDGTLVVVDKAIERAVHVPNIASTLQQAVDDWTATAPSLNEIYTELNAGRIAGFELDPCDLAAPLPRAYQWLDGSAYLSHVERVRKARGADLPAQLWTDPLMYQGVSDHFLGPRDPIVTANADWGVDFEAEVAVITDDVPAGVTVADARSHIILLLLVNDVSLRNLIPAELAKGFGFLHGKPPSACSPVVVTPDELAAAWDGTRLHLPLLSSRNSTLFGAPDAGIGMQFNFADLIAHACKTRPLGAGTVLGSGTVSNDDAGKGYSCIVERRMVETIETGQARTAFLADGERIRIEMLDESGQSIFGAMDNAIKICPT